MESTLPSRQPDMGHQSEHSAAAQAEPNTSACCRAYSHLEPDVGAAGETGKSRSDPPGTHTARDRADSLTAYDLSYQQNPQSARRNNFPGEQISRWFQLLSENLFASNYPGAAKSVYRVRTQEQIRARLALDMWREAQAEGRQQTLASLHQARAG